MADCYNVYRDGTFEVRKSRSFGCIVGFLSCGVTLTYDEAIVAEGMRPITLHLLRSIVHEAKMPRGLVYDASCTLLLHWKRFFGTPLSHRSANTEQLPEKIWVDYFHIRTHTRPICKAIMRPDDSIQEGMLKGVNTALAEQSFSSLTRLKMPMRNFTYPRSTTMLMLLSHLKNFAIVGIQHDTFGLNARHFQESFKSRYYSTLMGRMPPLRVMMDTELHQDIDVRHNSLQIEDKDEDITDTSH